MARDYQDNYRRGDYRSHDRDRSHQEEGGFFGRIGEKISNTWERMTGGEDEYSQRGSGHYPYSGEHDRGGYRTSSYSPDNSGSQGSRYGQSQLGRYSPQRSEGSNYTGMSQSGQGGSAGGYSGRMSDYGNFSQQRGQSQEGYGGSQDYGNASQGSSYGRSGSLYGAGSSKSEYGASERSGYGSSQPDYGSSSGYGDSSGYGRSSMGFPRGSDYGRGGSGSMGGGYFGSGAGPWSGGPYSNTGSAGYRAGGSQHRDFDSGYSSSDYDYSRREQMHRGQQDQDYGNEWGR
ncbi:hypothetical protein [Pontibacter ramchanderi]|uniref:Uncharacterized protein n=1 Tax=Pontibacter ramchanderi TaxID=1179743 RepID=A0A2N3U7W3_9BACT|nr:hypothetical protein [Pontibacter ramchanderi]PKV62824.1 hypothetical protein BD749_2654 [Pontibacter ramchanderi]